MKILCNSLVENFLKISCAVYAVEIAYYLDVWYCACTCACDLSTCTPV